MSLAKVLWGRRIGSCLADSVKAYFFNERDVDGRLILASDEIDLQR